MRAETFRAFLWGVLLGFLLLQLLCREKRADGQSIRPVVKVETLRIYRPETVEVIRWREKLVGWHFVKPETVVISPETALVETIFPERQTYWEVGYARRKGNKLFLLAGKYFWDSTGKAWLTLRRYTYELPDEWVLYGNDTGVVFKGRYKWTLKPFLGVGVYFDPSKPENLQLRPNLGVKLQYRHFKIRVEVQGTQLHIGGYYEW